MDLRRALRLIKIGLSLRHSSPSKSPGKGVSPSPPKAEASNQAASPQSQARSPGSPPPVVIVGGPTSQPVSANVNVSVSIPQPPSTEPRPGTAQPAPASPASQPVIVVAAPVQIPRLKETKEQKFLKDFYSVIIPKEVVEKIKKIRDEYPLIKLKINGDEFVAAKALIKWDDNKKTLVYNVIEPKLDEEGKKKLEKIKKYIVEKLDIDFTTIKNVDEAKKYIFNKAKEAIKKIGIKFKNKDEKRAIFYYLYRDLVGLEKIEPLMQDPEIEDISCDGVGVPVFIYHRNPLYGEMPTNIVFETKEELDNFVMKLAQRCGRSISVAQPLLDGSLPDGSRVQATFGSDISMKGSNFTIRKFTKEPLTPVDLIRYGTADEVIFAYYWMAIEARMSMLVAGPTASGKTTMLNAVALFIPPEMKIVSIEDTPELKLPHPNWVAQVARAAFGPSGYGEVSMYDLLKAALRQRPDYIIVGEVRGKEAYVLFQAMATGHASLGTIHAENMDALINRLTTPPIELPKPMLTNLDLVTFMIGTKRRGRFIRRVNQVVEITGYDYSKDKLLTNVAFSWDPVSDRFHVGKSYLLEKIGRRLGLTREEIRREVMRRALVLRWMVKKNIRHYEEFWKVIKSYYYNPSDLLDKIMKDLSNEKW